LILPQSCALFRKKPYLHESIKPTEQPFFEYKKFISFLMHSRLTSLVVISAFLIFCLPIQAQESLPKWMTPQEKAIYQEYLDNLPEGKSTQPPTTPPRTPAEFEEAQGVIITWASYTSELREIVRHARNHVTVYIVCSNPANVQSYLTAGNVPLSNVVFIQAPFNSVWVRDYGPQSVYLAEDNQLALIDWVYNRPRPDDNLIPGVMANFLDLPLYQMTSSPNRLVATGGNFMTDGHGKGFSSSLILAENSSLTEAQVDHIKYQYMGITTYIKMPELPYDNISHLDMHMKLLDEETLLVGEFPQGVSDGPYIESNLQNLLANHNSSFDRPYRVVRIPMAPSSGGNYPPQAHYRTYTNSVILNGLVLVPTYGHYLDSQALEIYQEAMPGYEIVGIHSENIISASGAIHCITREIAAEDPIFISHSWLMDRNTGPEGIEIAAYIQNHAGIADATLFWTDDLSIGFYSEDMTLQNDTFYAHIPAQTCPTDIHYYISATNVNEKTITKPLVAPAGHFTFALEGDVLDVFADKNTVELEEAVNLSMEFCGDGVETATWDFGAGAQPPTASGSGPHEVTYTTSGHKTVSLTVNDEHSVVKENIVLVNDPDSLILLVSIEGQGSTVPGPGSYNLLPGTTQELSASPAGNWKFLHWVVSGQPEPLTDAQITITMSANTTATAIFEQDATNITDPGMQPLLFSVYPNPSQGKAFLDIAPTGQALELLVTNLQGQMVLQRTLPPSQVEVTEIIDLLAMPAGVYLVRLANGQQSRTQRLLVQ
jgi:agmatine deiminase